MLSHNKKITTNRIIDWIFYIVYILLFILTILDLCSVPIPFIDNYTKDSNYLLRFLLMLFSSVGIVVLNDKRDMAKKVVKPIEYIEKTISMGEANDSNLTFLSNKDEFYMLFDHELQHLKSGAEVLVTAFDKNQGLDYYTGENKHIEAFMDDWSNKIKSNTIVVKQIVHIFTKKEYSEIESRANQYKDCYNYSLGAVTGMPIRPYIDVAIIDKKIVLLSFSNDANSPCDTGFGLAIRNVDVAENFEKYFNIYWNGDCRIIKNREGINLPNLLYFKPLTKNTTNYPNTNEYNKLIMELIPLMDKTNGIPDLIGDFQTIFSKATYWLPQKIATMKYQNLFNEIHNRIIMTYLTIKPKDVQDAMLNSISKAKKEIRATSIEIEDDSYWSSKDGEAFFAQNINGIAKGGITVNRVFIIRANQVETMSSIIGRQKLAGVKVFEIITEMTTRGSYKDFIIIDNDVVIEILKNGSARMYINKEIIDEYIKIYESYIAQSKQTDF